MDRRPPFRSALDKKAPTKLLCALPHPEQTEVTVAAARRDDRGSDTDPIVANENVEREGTVI